jgi:hypothetical protein
MAIADELKTSQELHERGNHVVKGSLILLITLIACNKTLSFCWYGSELVSDPQVTAYGNTSRQAQPLLHRA